jgi:hypothetical protein
MTTVYLEEDSDGELILPLDFDLINQMGWNVGDTLQWIDNGDGTYSIKKHEDSNSQ